MDRVHTLAKKLQEQIAQNASLEKLLVTVSMLQSELQHKKLTQPAPVQESSVTIDIALSKNAAPTEQEMPGEKTIEVLQVDEAELEAE